MSIRTYFENIAEAIKEKNPEVLTIAPGQMPQAIRDIETGGGVELISQAEWDALSVEQKKQKGLIAVQSSMTGFLRGALYYGADYGMQWDKIKKIALSGSSRGVSSSYVQLGDIRFSDGSNYLSSQVNNIYSSTTKYGGFMSGGNQGDTRYLFDNNAGTKTISSGGPSFEWTTIFTNPIDLSTYNIMEFWTANDASERDPINNIVLLFEGTNGVVGTLTLGNITVSTARNSLGYANNSYKSEVVI